MTEFLALGAFFLAHLLALASPGPNLLIVGQTAASRTRRAGLWVTAGIATGAAFWSTVALLSLNLVFDHIPAVYAALRIAGGLYLIILGVKMWRTADAPFEAPQRAPLAISSQRSYRLGLLTALTNPKAALFFGSVLSALFPPSSPFWLKAAAICLVVVDSLGFHSAIACLFSLPRVQAGYHRVRRWTDRLAGGALAVLGLRLATTGDR